MLDRKQNVFDDFHAAAEHLIATGVTSPARLAVWGGSNGGLLVGAAITQRPDLFSAAVCSAPLLDMVRYERFPIGETWNTEYGTAASPVELEWLLGYSPYHHVVDGTAYPAVLFTVFSNDTRVDPLHGYKMCAALQHATVVRAAGAAARRGAGGTRAARGVAVGLAGGRLPRVRGPRNRSRRRLAARGGRGGGLRAPELVGGFRGRRRARRRAGTTRP